MQRCRHDLFGGHAVDLAVVGGSARQLFHPACVDGVLVERVEHLLHHPGHSVRICCHGVADDLGGVVAPFFRVPGSVPFHSFLMVPVDGEDNCGRDDG